MNEKEIYNIKYESGKIKNVQTTFIDISIISPEINAEFRIDFIGKREANLKNNYNFNNLEINSNHVINLQFYEDFFEVFFNSASNSSFEVLLSTYKEKINNLYLPYKNWNKYINRYFAKNIGFESNLSGVLGIAPYSIANQLLNSNFSDVQISLIPIGKLYQTSGKVLTLDNCFVWSEDFVINERKIQKNI